MLCFLQRGKQRLIKYLVLYLQSVFISINKRNTTRTKFSHVQYQPFLPHFLFSSTHLCLSASQTRDSSNSSRPSPWPCLYLCIESTLLKGSRCISLPLQGSPYECVGYLVPVPGPCRRICRGGLFVGILAFSSFSPPSSWQHPVPSV